MSVYSFPISGIRSSSYPISTDNYEVRVGKDVLELLTGAMYADPLSVYREYVQNATDAIDDVVDAEGYVNGDRPHVAITTNLQDRSVTITDTGAGVSNEAFFDILTAIGGSQKRGTSHRGFRGVGRLSGLGYCQELVFRSRSLGDDFVYELKWDGRKLKNILNDNDWSDGLDDAIKLITDVTKYLGAGYPNQFFEVELRKILRLKNDILLNEDVIKKYLSQVAPVPFDPEFKFSGQITEYLLSHTDYNEYDVSLNGRSNTILRPFKNSFEIKEALSDSFHDLATFELPGLNGGTDAIGWMLDHSYMGAIPEREGISGLRFRSKNIQVGNRTVAAEIFPEARFNSWTVGEIHVLNDTISPNGRRDNYEASARFFNILNHLTPIGKTVAKRCREESSIRNRIKSFDWELTKVSDLNEILEQGVVGDDYATQVRNKITETVDKMNFILSDPILNGGVKAELSSKLNAIRSDEQTPSWEQSSGTGLDIVPEAQRELYGELFGWIYECSANRVVAKALVDKLLRKLEIKHS